MHVEKESNSRWEWRKEKVGYLIIDPSSVYGGPVTFVSEDSFLFFMNIHVSEDTLLSVIYDFLEVLDRTHVVVLGHLMYTLT